MRDRGEEDKELRGWQDRCLTDSHRYDAVVPEASGRHSTRACSPGELAKQQHLEQVCGFVS